ncbi:MAG TPA: MFS transporter, partial [Ktedonobacteraceae bacterium]|nr:MFS transporter [Ktedonobacteraceae bacterium]
GLIVLVIFVIVELSLGRRERQTLVDLRLFTNGPFLTSNIANALITFAFFGGLFIFPIYLQNLRGLSAFQAGLLLLPQAFASIISALIGGRVVDRVGVRVVVIPGLVVLAFTLWQFTFLTLDTPFLWLQGMFVLRGIALGLIIQPLNVSALSDINPRRFAQASSLYTVVRFVSTSLGIAVLATLVQSQAKVHYSHLAELVTPASPLGQLVTRLQQYFFTQGFSLQNTRAAAIQQVIRLVQRQGYMLALQDAFWLTFIVALIAIVAVFFIRSRPQPTVASSNGGAQSEGEEDHEAEPRVLVIE